MNYSVVAVQFVDSHTDEDGGWKQLSTTEVTALTPVEAVGFLVYEDEDFVVLAVAVAAGGFSAARMYIPKVSIIQRKVLGQQEELPLRGKPAPTRSEPILA